MKRIIVTLLLVLWLTPSAHAFTVKEEVQVVPPPQSYTEPEPSPTIGEVKSTVNKLLVSSRHKIEAAMGKKDSATAKSINAINAEVTTAKNDIIAGQTANATAVTTAVGTAKDDIIAGQTTSAADVKTAVGAAIDNAKNEIIASQTDGNRNTWILVIGILLVIATATVIFFVRRSTTAITSAVATVRNQVANVETRVSAVSATTVSLLKELESFTETFTIASHEVTITAIPVDGGYPTLYVPKLFSTEIANPTEITTKKAHTRGEFCADTISIMKKYLTGGFNGADGYSLNQKKVIEYAIGNGNLSITRIV